MNKYIIALLVIFIFVMLAYVYEQINKLKNKCSILEQEYLSLDIVQPSESVSSKPINHIVFKSAYNCCCIGNLKNDYVDLCALKNCYHNGVRVLDFQIFALNNKPVISASSINENEYKEIYNYISLSEAMLTVKQYFCNTYKNPNNKEVLFLNFRINSNNKEIYNEIANILKKTFNQKAEIFNPITESKSIDEYTLDELKHKVIIMVDLNASPNFKNLFYTTELSKLTLIKLGSNELNHAIQENEVIYQGSGSLSSIYPKKQMHVKNYDYKTKGIQNNFHFVFMNYQLKDNWLKKYNDEFNNSSFIIKTP